MRKTFLALPVLLGLAACSSPVRMPCPAIPVWSAAEQQELSNELTSAGPALQRAALELYDFRVQSRICRKVYGYPKEAKK